MTGWGFLPATYPRSATCRALLGRGLWGFVGFGAQAHESLSHNCRARSAAKGCRLSSIHLATTLGPTKVVALRTLGHSVAGRFRSYRPRVDLRYAGISLSVPFHVDGFLYKAKDCLVNVSL